MTTRLEGSEIIQLLMHPEAAAAINIYSYTPRQIATLINNMVYPTILSANTEDTRKLVSITHSFGSKIYGESSGDGKWSCWWANRKYCIAFEFDLTTSTFSNIRYSTPKDPIYTGLNLPDTTEPTCTADSLIVETYDIRWKAYQQTVEELPYYLILQEAEKKVTVYYEQEKQRFHDVRVAALTLFSPFEQPDPSMWIRQVPTPSEQGLIHDTEQSMPRYEIYPHEVSAMLTVQLGTVFAAGEKPDYSRNIINQAVGYRHRTSRVDSDTWKIWAEGLDQAVEYRWNVKQGTVEGVSYYKKSSK